MRITRRLGLSLLGAAGLGLEPTSPTAGSAQPQDTELVYFAAASLKNALDDVAAPDVAGRPGSQRQVSYGASPALARQIEAGAPADLFVSADLDWMDYLARSSSSPAPAEPPG